MTNAELIELLKQDNHNAGVHIEIYIGERRWVGIPRNATNGDMIKAMFPSVEIKEKNNCYEVYFGIGTASQYFNHQWWNAPYKGSEG